MTTSYTDIKVVECNRLHSEEAKSNNDENFALWTNNLQDIVHLDVGDKVSVHGAMVSERGAGQSSSIEIKGVDLGFQQTWNYIEISGSNASSEIPSGFEVLSAVPNASTISVRDDTAYFKISYYVNMDGHNYIQLPRRWWYKPTRQSGNFTNYDDRIAYGMSLSDPFATNDYVLYDDFYQLSGTAGYGEVNQDNGNLSKVRNDNSRFTIMMRDNTYYSESSASGNLADYGERDPENAIYYMYEELKSIKVEKGFNSPEYISEDITRQLQEVKSQQVFEKRSATDLTNNPNRPGFPVPVYGTYSTETYKPFNCAGLYAVNTNVLTDTPETYFDYYIKSTGGLTNGSGWEYLQNYHIVGCKRPELYTTGRLINVGSNGSYVGIYGTTTQERYDGTFNDISGTIGIETSISYTLIDKFRDFILAQEKYPEVWNIFSDSRTPYDSGDNINNSRWFHMNRYANASMTGTYLNVQLGWGGYVLPTGGNASSNYNSVVVPFQYDDSQRDKFYENPVESLGERSYGCFGRSNDNYIIIYPTDNNGSGSTLFNMLNNNSNNIETGRKCGYDMHFTAPATAWCLPYSGFTQTPIDYDNRGQAITDYRIARNSQSPVLDNYKVDTSDQRRQLYLGADEPTLKWDGTHFSFSQLHTALYRGNSDYVDAPFATIATDIDNQANEKVFKINPIELYEDYTPARMPYIEKVEITIDPSGSGDKKFFSKVLNSNLEPWTIYDSQCGIAIEDFGLDVNQWKGTLWDLLGFSYKQFHSSTNNRLQRIDNTNLNDLSVITTNANVLNEKSQAYSQNMWGVPLYNNMMPLVGSIVDKHDTFKTTYFPPIIVQCDSVDIVADNLPTRMIRGYYTIRSNLLSDTPFIGGKINNTTMPIIGIVDKINGDGDFYFGSESSLEFTITKPLRLASLTCSIHDPDGSYANCSEQNTILFKIQKNKVVSFNVVQDIIQQNKGKVPAFL